MKVFEFWQGGKGRQLDNLPLITWTGNALLNDQDGAQFKISADGLPGEGTWHREAGRTAITGDQPIDVSSYGVPAICFCIGHVICGADDYWQWVVLTESEDAARKLIRDGYLTATPFD